MVPNAVIAWLLAEGFGEVSQVQPVGGGCINHGARVRTTGDRTVFLKTNPAAPADMFSVEGSAIKQPAGGRRSDPT